MLLYLIEESLKYKVSNKHFHTFIQECNRKNNVSILTLVASDHMIASCEWVIVGRSKILTMCPSQDSTELLKRH